MHLRPSRFLAGCALGAVLGGVLPAAAQQSILFSKPTETAAEKANSFMLEAPSKLQGRAGEFNAPKQLFNFSPEPTPPLPVMPNIPSQSLRDALDKRKNWTLLTPEEILGVPTAEKILGLPDPTGNDKRTPEERYLRRQTLAAGLSATNALRRSDAALLRNDANPFAPRDERDQRGQLDPSGQLVRPDARADAGSRKYFDRMLNTPAQASMGAGPNGNSSWGSAFDQPAPLPKLNPEQIAARERYAAFLNQLSAPPEKVPVATRFSSPTGPTPDPNLQAGPQFNPLGQSYAPLQSSISRPTGIIPLPGLVTPRPPSTTPKKSLADLPPWLSKDPQPLDSPFNTRKW